MDRASKCLRVRFPLLVMFSLFTPYIPLPISEGTWLWLIQAPACLNDVGSVFSLQDKIVQVCTVYQGRQTVSWLYGRYQLTHCSITFNWYTFKFSSVKAIQNSPSQYCSRVALETSWGARSKVISLWMYVTCSLSYTTSSLKLIGV